MIRLLLALWLFAAAALCQVVHLANYSGAAWEGWVRTTIDRMPPVDVGQVAGATFVVGRQTGLDTRVVDVRTRLAPGQIVALDLSQATPWPAWRRGALPADPIAFFGAPSIAGVPLQFVSVVADGAGWDAHLRTRFGRMFAVDVWLTWWPDLPGWAIGEATVTASNPAVPDVTATVPTGFLLRFGAADVLVPGAGAIGAPLLPDRTVFGDGQSRSFPLTLVWRRHLRTPDEWSSAGAAANLGIAACGISQVWPTGNPALPAGSSPLAWTISHWSGAIESLHRWSPAPGVGPNQRSNDTGAQADQVFVGGECAALPAGLGAETVRYLVALSQGRRPCHHLEVDGELLRLALHPQLVLWDGRAHWHRAVSPDQLGKSRTLTELDTSGWWGPDVEHWLMNNLAVAARLRDSRALQRMLSAQARVYLLQWTVAAGLSTSQAYAARARGWEGLGVVWLWWVLEDRALAAQVRSRWLERWERILSPTLAAEGDRWDIRVDDARLGTGSWWIPWQQAVGAYGLDLAGRVFDVPAARAAAARGARRVVEDAWRLDGAQWRPYPALAVDGRGSPDDSFSAFGMALAPAVMLLQEPAQERAQMVWSQLLRDHRGGGQWFPPEMLRRQR